MRFVVPLSLLFLVAHLLKKRRCRDQRQKTHFTLTTAKAVIPCLIFYVPHNSEKYSCFPVLPAQKIKIGLMPLSASHAEHEKAEAF